MSRVARSRAAVAFLVAGVIDLATQARADAPAGQYSYYDQYTPYIIDQRTGLTWQRFSIAFPAAPPMDFAAATAYCAAYSVPVGALQKGWRVPSYKELLTLVDEVPHLQNDGLWHALDSRAFYDTPVDKSYWTSSLYPLPQNDQSVHAYIVNFKDGTGGHDTPMYTGYVRCVH